MLLGKKVLRIAAALAVAAASAHTAESLKATAEQPSLLVSAARLATADLSPDPVADPAVPQSASLASPVAGRVGGLTGITPVAATSPPAAGDPCRPELQLAALPGAMIRLTLAAPCNRAERFVVRHAGLSFSERTGADGRAMVTLPALRPDALVAVYLQEARLVLGKVTVPDAAAYARLAIVWELPVELDLRVAEGSEVPVIALGATTVQSPVRAQVYSVLGRGLGAAVITGELRITPATCGRTLRLETVYSASGVVATAERSVSVPLCGTADDILVLKNLAPAPKLVAPK